MQLLVLQILATLLGFLLDAVWFNSICNTTFYGPKIVYYQYCMPIKKKERREGEDIKETSEGVSLFLELHSVSFQQWGLTLRLAINYQKEIQL